ENRDETYTIHGQPPNWRSHALDPGRLSAPANHSRPTTTLAGSGVSVSPSGELSELKLGGVVVGYCWGGVGFGRSPHLSTVRLAALRRRHLGLAKSWSIGLRVGNLFGKKFSLAC